MSINPKLNRVVFVPNGIGEIWTTNEGHGMSLIENGPIVDIGYLVAALRTPYVLRQMVRLATGSSSSRARLGGEDVNRLKIPIVAEDKQIALGKLVAGAANASWAANQQLLQSLEESGKVLG